MNEDDWDEQIALARKFDSDPPLVIDWRQPPKEPVIIDDVALDEWKVLKEMIDFWKRYRRP